MQKSNPKHPLRKAQHQQRPGVEYRMQPLPLYDNKKIKGSGKLEGKTALISGGDSGIGRAVSVLFAKEGADISIIYLKESTDALLTKKEVEFYGRKCLLIPGDISREKFCEDAVEKSIKNFNKIDILVNNAGIHYPSDKIENISSEQLVKTFATNFFSIFWLSKAAIPKMKKNSVIINTASVTAYRGSGGLIDYASTKGAIVSFTRSLSASLVDKGIRVNGVAPGPVWDPADRFKF